MSKKLKVAKDEKEQNKKEETHLDLITFLSDSIQKDFGDEAIMQMSADSKHRTKKSFSYGWRSLDEASGIDGLPAGRIIEIYGPESSGKTTLTLHCAKECQKKKGVVCFIDAEHAMDIKYAEALGINTNEWLLNQPDHGEQAFAIANKLILAKKKKEEDNPQFKEIPLLIVVDSVATLTPEAEIKGILEEGKGSGLGAQARMMSEGLRGMTSIMGKTNTNVIFINQTRSKIGGYGNPEVTTGGNALKFYASVRIRVSKGETEKIGEEVIGCEIKAKIVKNKMAPPFKEASGLIVFGEGIDQIWDIWNKMIDNKTIASAPNKEGKVDPKGIWKHIPKIPEIKKFAGYKQFKAIYKENSEAIDKILLGE